MNRSRVLHAVLSCAFVFALAPKFAMADDFAPPPWPRADPRAITAEWEFLAPVNPLAPDGPLSNVAIKGSGTAPGGSLATLTGTAGLGWGIGDGDGGWFFPGGGDIRFRVDNIVDLEPFKFLRVQVTHSAGLPIAMDLLAAFNFGATGSTAVGLTTTHVDPFHTLFTWDMFPNPPWEDFDLLVMGGGEIDEVVVDTISLPEPSSLALFAVLSLGLTARRRKA